MVVGGSDGGRCVEEVGRDSCGVDEVEEVGGDGGTGSGGGGGCGYFHHSVPFSSRAV